MTRRLDDLLDGDPADLLVHAGGVDHTRGEIESQIAELAAALDIEPGTPVGVQLPDGADVVVALFAVWRAGGVYVPLNPRLGADDLAHAVAATRPAVLVTTDGLQPGVADPASHDPGVALIQFTSGTTGRPKPVLLLHDGVLDLVDGVLAKLGSRRATTPMPNLVPVSLSLWAGIYNVLFAFRVGAPVVLMDGFATTTFAELVRRFAIRSTVLPPAAMAMLADDERIDSLDPLRFVRSITAPLSPLQARRFKDRFGIAVLNSYGQTEIGGEIVGWNAADSREHGEDKLGSVGRPHAGVELRVVDGELWVRTPAMSAGYADGTDLSDRLSPDGWFRTGDVGRVDDDGFVWIEGRVSDMVNRGGLKVFPAEVEEVLRLHPSVDDAAVVGRSDDRLGEVPVAFVVGTGVDAADLERHCREHLAPYKVPVAFHPVDALPRNEVGKVLKAALSPPG